MKALFVHAQVRVPYIVIGEFEKKKYFTSSAQKSVHPKK